MEDGRCNLMARPTFVTNVKHVVTTGCICTQLVFEHKENTIFTRVPICAEHNNIWYSPKRNEWKDKAKLFDFEFQLCKAQ